MQPNIETLLEQLTIEEKISLLAGASMWHTVAIPRLGIPAFKMSDGPNGARGSGTLMGGLPSACLPVGIALAATWNPELMKRIGQVIGEEVKAKGAHLLLAPTVNIHRSPLSGRNFECYSEDPYLTARMAVAYIKGVQSQNVGATIKHYVCNDSEFQRHTISSEVRERPLREIYLPPFEAAVKEAKVWAIMASYNRINGTYASENRATLLDILHDEWGFEGLVVSDWFGTASIVTATANGLDLEMPGPTQWRGEKLLQAFHNGEISETIITERARRVLTTAARAGVFEHPEELPERTLNKPEHRVILREAAAEGMVLLKHTPQVLPMDLNSITSLALIGPNVKSAKIMGGGSSRVNAYYAVTPFEGIVNKVGEKVKIGYEMGCTNYRSLPLLAPDWLTLPNNPNEYGLVVEYFNSADLSGEVVWTTTTTRSEQVWIGDFAPQVNAQNFSARFTTRLSLPESGRYQLQFGNLGLSRLLIDGVQVVDHWTTGSGGQDTTIEFDFSAGQSYHLQIEFSKGNVFFAPGVRLGCFLPLPADAIARAAKLAGMSDVAIVFVGLSEEWESEGYDRPNIALVGDQVKLIEAVAAANKQTIVVVQTGSPIEMPWLDKAAAVLQAWYPGQECGNAMADVLFGDVNPSGKLSQTFPKRLEDNPAYINYPGENNKVYYGEGIFVGYRYYDKKQIEPLFPFGHGLSYTTFAYRNLRLNKAEYEAGEEIQVSLELENTGERSGKEVVQVYVRDLASSLARPEKELKAFAKVALEPGETQTVTLTLTREALAYYDDFEQQWVAEAGEFEVLVGSSSRDIRATARFTLKTTAMFGGPEKIKHQFSIFSTIQQLLKHDAAKAVLQKYLPNMTDAAHVDLVTGFTLQQMAAFAPVMFPGDIMQAIEAELAKI